MTSSTGNVSLNSCKTGSMLYSLIMSLSWPATIHSPHDGSVGLFVPLQFPAERAVIATQAECPVVAEAGRLGGSSTCPVFQELPDVGDRCCSKAFFAFSDLISQKLQRTSSEILRSQLFLVNLKSSGTERMKWEVLAPLPRHNPTSITATVQLTASWHPHSMLSSKPSISPSTTTEAWNRRGELSPTESRQHPHIRNSRALRSSSPLTLTLQSLPRLTGWSRPLTDRWVDRRAEWRWSLRFLGQVRCWAFCFRRRSLQGLPACCFPLEDRGAGDRWPQSLQKWSPTNHQAAAGDL